MGGPDSTRVDDFLRHFGVKGMHWGVRRTAQQRAATRKQSSKDARAAGDAHNKHKTVGLHALSNEELQTLIKRMDLEQRYSKLHKERSSTLASGHNKVKNILSVSKTVTEVAALAKSPVGRVIGATIKYVIQR